MGSFTFSPAAQESDPLYQAGTLKYSKAGLVAVFFWILWGDFVLNLMEQLQITVIPLILKWNGATDKEIAIIITTIASVLNAVINPIVSFKSDRTRSRYGRRIPYLFVATPFVSLILMGMPYVPKITYAALNIGFLRSIFGAFPVAPIILIFGGMMFLFQMFHMVVASIYYYLFRDVIPVGQLWKFMAFFRVCSSGTTFVFQYFLFGKVVTHLHQLFIGLSLIYCFGFMLMCWRVKEGEYPPVEATEKVGGGIRQAAGNFLLQSFGAPIYVWIYIARTLGCIAVVSNTFIVFFLTYQLGLSYDTVGKLNAWPSLLCLPLAFPFGLLIKKWGSMRAVIISSWIPVVAGLAAFLFIRGLASYFVFGIFINVATFFQMLCNSVWQPIIFHKERMGQLCAACALVSALAVAVTSPFCGMFLHWIGDYRYAYGWGVVFNALSLMALYRVRREWRKLGGSDNYRPPLPGAPAHDADIVVRGV